MKVVYTDAALADLDEILSFIAANYPAIADSFQQRLRIVTGRIAAWPESAAEVQQRPGIRVVPLVRYPYRIFYRTSDGRVEILHISHAARNDALDV